MMNANDVIECWVNDVAMQLPRKQRNDVAFELRALLNEELQDKAEAAGRNADADMAIELLRAFGRPADVAARYRPTLTIIDPADGHAFLRATLIGLAIIWSAGLLVNLQQPAHSPSGFLGVLGNWWLGTVIPSLWWPGVLVAGFGLSSWARHRRPQSAEWMPRAADHIPGNRASLVLGLIGIACGVFVLLDPHWLLDVLFGGRAAPAAYDALTYTESFRQRQAPVLLALILLNIPMLITVIVKGRWSVNLRRMQTASSLATCAALAWTVIDGPAFNSTASDQTFKFFLVVIIVITLIDIGIKLYRRVNPMPNTAA